MLKRDWGVASNGKLANRIIPGKTAAWISKFAVEDLSSAELQAWFLHFQQWSCPWTEHSDNVDNYYYYLLGSSMA